MFFSRSNHMEQADTGAKGKRRCSDYRAHAADTPALEAAKRAKKVRYVLGIDEAGRGPIIGPMVYACAYCPVDEQDAYRARGYRDSKGVRPAERERLFAALLDDPEVGFNSRVIRAEEISNAYYSHTDRRNLNELSYDAAIALVRSVLESGVDVAKLYVDAVGDCGTYRATLCRLFPDIDEVVVESKADVTYPIVSVASIVAKTLRDGIIESLRFKEHGIEFDRDYGNGYPSTPAVTRWLARFYNPVFGYPSAVRFNWRPVESKVTGRIAVHWEHDVGGRNRSKRISPSPSISRLPCTLLDF